MSRFLIPLEVTLRPFTICVVCEVLKVCRSYSEYQISFKVFENIHNIVNQVQLTLSCANVVSNVTNVIYNMTIFVTCLSKNGESIGRT